MILGFPSFTHLPHLITHPPSPDTLPLGIYLIYPIQFISIVSMTTVQVLSICCMDYYNNNRHLAILPTSLLPFKFTLHTSIRFSKFSGENQHYMNSTIET